MFWTILGETQKITYLQLVYCINIFAISSLANFISLKSATLKIMVLVFFKVATGSIIQNTTVFFFWQGAPLFFDVQ